MNKTKIEWTETTWNPITGCNKYSSGCDNCYAEKMANRLYHMKNPRYEKGFQVTIHKDLFEKPLKMKSSKIIFVCSMSDLFHKNVSDEIILELFEIMEKAHWHIFQVLTKRTKRMHNLLKNKKIPDNIWIGTTVESNENVWRVDLIRDLDVKVKFLSCEPLLNDLKDLNTKNIEWVVVGGESGSNARPLEKEWVLNLRNKSHKSDSAFFFKQWGGWNKKKNGKLLDGKTYEEMPLFNFKKQEDKLIN